MSEFVKAGYTKADLLSLNIVIVRMHKMVIHLSDIVRCDGKTMTAEALAGELKLPLFTKLFDPEEAGFSRCETAAFLLLPLDRTAYLDFVSSL